MRYALIAIAALAVAGCAAAHQTDPDAATQGDGARDDARDPCTVAGLPRCDSACGRDQMYCADLRTPSYCVGGVCLPRRVIVPDVEEDGCGSDAVCPGSNICVLDSLGLCMPESFCDEAAAEGYPVPCTWSDGTRRVSGSPRDATSCPLGGPLGPQLCGPPCADLCPLFAPHYMFPELHVYAQVGLCWGRSDSRQFGICVPLAGCVRGMRDAVDATDDPMIEGTQQVYPELGTGTPVCIVFRNGTASDGLNDDGYATSEEACRSYRALYPDDVECVIDRDWHTLP